CRSEHRRPSPNHSRDHGNGRDHAYGRKRTSASMRLHQSRRWHRGRERICETWQFSYLRDAGSHGGVVITPCTWVARPSAKVQSSTLYSRQQPEIAGIPPLWLAQTRLKRGDWPPDTPGGGQVHASFFELA